MYTFIFNSSTFLMAFLASYKIEQSKSLFYSTRCSFTQRGVVLLNAARFYSTRRSFTQRDAVLLNAARFYSTRHSFTQRSTVLLNAV